MQKMTVNTFTRKSNRKLCPGWPLALLLTLCTQTAIALPFGVFDARTMAMGGVGVATGPKFAVFNNPALLATADETHEWFLLAPTLSLQVSDPDNAEDSLRAFQRAADILDNDNNSANRAAVQQQLNTLNGSLYSTSRNSAFVLAIPSRILSGAAFFNVYEASTARPMIGGDNLTATPNYASTLAQRGLRVVENGITAAKALDGKNWTQSLTIGFSAKFLLVSGYGYADPLRNADVDINRNRSKKGSQFIFDIGVLKEFGVWKVGLVAKNIIPGNYKYGDSDDTFKLEPQLRAGFAYQSRYSVLELDIDLLKNAAVGFGSDSQIVALGWEWQTWQWLTLRAGYNQNLTGDETTYGSAGIGLQINTLQIDVAAYSGNEGEGASAQLGLQF